MLLRPHEYLPFLELGWPSYCRNFLSIPWELVSYNVFINLPEGEAVKLCSILFVALKYGQLWIPIFKSDRAFEIQDFLKFTDLDF